MQTFFVKKNKYLFFTLLVFILAFGIRCYKFSDKGHLFLDEYLSIVISNGNGYGWSKTYENDSTIFRGQDLTAVFLSDTNDFSSIIEDLTDLRLNNSDPVHTNLYYSLTRVSLWGADCDADSIFLRYFMLNMLFFLVSFLLFYLILRKFEFNNLIIIGAIGIAFLNPISVANTLFLRPYSMQECLFLFFAYSALSYSCALICREKHKKWTSLLIYTLSTALVLLSGYFAIFYVFLVSLLLLLITIKYDKKSIWFLILVFSLAVIILFIIYPIFTRGIYSNRSNEAISKLDFSVMFQNAWDSLVLVVSKMLFLEYSLIITGLVTILVGMFLVQKVVKKSLKKQSLPIAWFVIGLVWCWATLYIAPYKVDRYISPAITLLLLFFPILMASLEQKKHLFFAISFPVLLFFATSNYTGIYWYREEVDQVYLDNPNIASIIAGSKYSEQIIAIPYFTDDRYIELTFSQEDLLRKIEKYDQLYLFIASASSHDFSIPKGYEVEYTINTLSSYEVYRLRKK